MPYAVTHLLVPLILLQLFRDYVIKNKQTFPLHYVLIGGLAGLLPDIDVAVYWFIFYTGVAFDSIHRTFTHTLFTPLIFIILGFAFWNFKNEWLGKRHMNLRTIFFVISFGTFIHLILDATVSGSITPIYPFSSFAVGLSLVSILPEQLQFIVVPTLDAALLIIWITYLEVKHKISSFL